MKKDVFFAFSHLIHFFVTHGQITVILKLFDLILSAFKNRSSKFGNQTKNSFYIIGKLRKLISLQSKKRRFCNLYGLKAV